MAENREYTIRRTRSAVKLNLDSPSWDQAERLEIDRYPWYVKGAKQATSVAMLYDEQALYLLAVCEDKHIYSVETRPNGNVYLDSCVEFFCMPVNRSGAATREPVATKIPPVIASASPLPDVTFFR